MEKLIQILSENNISEESINKIVMSLMKNKKKEPTEKGRALSDFIKTINANKETYKKGVETPEVQSAKAKYKSLCCSLSGACYNDLVELVEDFINEIKEETSDKVWKRKQVNY